MLEFKTERLIVHEITPDDLEHIHRKNSIREVEEFNTIGIPKSFEETVKVCLPVLEDQASLKRSKYGWVIKEKETQDFIGEIGLTLAAERFRKGEIHYSLLPEFWGKGYAYESVKEVIKYAFTVLKLHRIEAGVATENIRSIKLLEKLGMVREGVGRKILPIRGDWKDNYKYAILENDERDY